jgi:hypothetical protein
VFVGSFGELAVDEGRAGTDERDETWGVNRAPAVLGARMSFNAIASPAAREPGPLVILLWLRTVAKVDSIGEGGGGPSASTCGGRYWDRSAWAREGARLKFVHTPQEDGDKQPF